MLLLLTLSLAWASPKSDLTSGVVACENGETAMGVEKLGAAMAQADQLKEKDLAKGWYYLGHCTTQLIAEGGAGPERALDAADALLAAEANDDAGRYQGRIDLDQVTVTAWLQGLATLAGDRAAPPEAQAIGQQAIERLLAHDPNDYFAHLAAANAALARGDHAAMGRAATAALDAYEAHPPAPPDPSIGMAGVQLAASVGMFADPPDAEAALAALERARGLLEGMKGADPARLEAILAELERTELSLYLQFPELKSHAIARFEAALAKAPDDVGVKLALANLLEDQDMARARALYTEVTVAAPDSSLAWFNLGATYVNESLELNRQLMDSFDPDPELQARYDALSAQARAAFEGAHAADPSDVEVLRQLERLAIEANDTEAYKAYKAKRAALQGG